MMSYLCENEAKNLQNGDIYPAQIPDLVLNGISREQFGTLRSMTAYFPLLHALSF